MRNYKAILFAPDGEFITDFRDRAEIQDVWNEVADMGSKWIFYPIPFVATEKTIVSTPEGLEYLKGKRISTVKSIIQNCNTDNLCEHLNNGWPLHTAIN